MQPQPAYNPQYVPPGYQQQYAQVPHKHDFFIDIVVPYWPHVTTTFALLVLLKLYGPLGFALLVTFKDWLFRDRKATSTPIYVGVGPDGRPVDLNTTITKCLERFFPADPNASADSSVDPNDAADSVGGRGGAGQRSSSGKKSGSNSSNPPYSSPL